MPSTNYEAISAMLDTVFDETENLAQHMANLNHPNADEMANHMRGKLVEWHDVSTNLLVQLRNAPDGPIKDQYRDEAIAQFTEMRSFIREMRGTMLAVIAIMGTMPQHLPEV